MARPKTQRPLTHDFEIGELIALAEKAFGFYPRHVCQIVGFKGETKLRLLPLGGTPIIVPVGNVMRVGLPPGSSKLPQRRRRWSRRPKKQSSQRETNRETKAAAA